MKNLITLLLLTLTSLAFGQSQNIEITTTKEKNEFESFSPKISSNGIYLGFGGLYSNYKKNEFVGFQARIAYVLNNAFEIGLGSEVFTSKDLANIGNETTDRFYGSLGALQLKAIIQGNKKVHFSIPVSFGAGAVALEESKGNIFEECVEFNDQNWDPILYLDAGVNVEFNISRFIGFEIGGKYRRSTDFDLNNYNLSNLNGFSFAGMLKIGLFNFGRN